MKEATQTPYNRCIFRETFSSETETRKQASSVTDVTISKGIGSFNGTSSYIKYNKVLNGVYSVRIKAKNINPSSSCTYIDFRNSSGTGTGYITGGNINLGVSSGTVYVNGVATAIVNVTSSDIVITGMTINCFEIFLNTRYSLANWLGSDVDLVEIYEGTLTASEVKNLYRNSWAKDDIKKDLLLDFDSTNGYITDRTGKNTLTATDVSIKKTGIYYSADFNGSTSTIVTDSTDPTIWQSGFTLMAWINLRSYGGANYGRIFDKSINTASDAGFYFSVEFSGNRFAYQLSGGAILRSNNNVFVFNKWYFVVVTVSSDSKINFYVGDLNNAPTLSGIANRTSGLITSITTTNPVTIGNRSTKADRGFDGLIKMAKAYSGVLSLEDLTQIWSSTRGRVN